MDYIYICVFICWVSFLIKGLCPIWNKNWFCCALCLQYPCCKVCMKCCGYMRLGFLLLRTSFVACMYLGFITWRVELFQAIWVCCYCVPVIRVTNWSSAIISLCLWTIRYSHRRHNSNLYCVWWISFCENLFEDLCSVTYEWWSCSWGVNVGLCLKSMIQWEWSLLCGYFLLELKQDV